MARAASAAAKPKIDETTGMDVPGNQNIIAMHVEKNQGRPGCNHEPEEKPATEALRHGEKQSGMSWDDSL
jgi:hypothetical protein